MKLITKAYAMNEYGEGPSFAVIDLTPELIQRLESLHQICKDHNLHRAVVWGSPEAWDQENELRLRGDTLQVDDQGEAHWAAYPKYGDYLVETSAIRVEWLKLLLADGQHPYVRVLEGIAYYPDSEADDLQAMYLNNIEAQEE